MCKRTVLALVSIVAATGVVSLSICSRSASEWGIVETIVSAMVSMTSGGGVPVSSCLDKGKEKGSVMSTVLRARSVIGKHPLIIELRYKADSSEWSDVLVFFCREVADEDIKIATKLNRLREEMLVIREKRSNLVDELRSIRGIVVVGKAAEFVSETVRKDNAQIEQLRGVESKMEVRALEKELHVQNIMGNIPY
ncbi:hypothetical protein Tco_0950684 [Tanacetum coccineum]